MSAGLRFDGSFPPVDIVPPSFDPIPPNERESSDSTTNPNHQKLLSFSPPTYTYGLMDQHLRRSLLSINAQLHGMFFLAESPWTQNGNGELPPREMAELTCYRRNLFQIIGSITLPRSLRYLMTDKGDRIPIMDLELTVSATESVEGNPVKIISVPWKTAAAAAAANGNGNGPLAGEEKVETEPQSIPLDTSLPPGPGEDPDFATVPIAWKRLQFRIATANNGRRKELQQHFVIRLKVMASLSTGGKVCVCESRSGPVIVRGRSPRNFQSRNDLPLSGSAASSRKHQAARNQSAASQKTPSPTATTSAAPQTTAASSSSPTEVSQMFPFDASGPAVSSPFGDWTQIPAPSTGSMGPPSLKTEAGYSQSSPSVSRAPDSQSQRRASVATSPPVPLSLADEDFKAPNQSAENATNGTTTVNPLKRTSPETTSSIPAKMPKISPSVTTSTSSGSSHARTASVSLPHSLPTATAALQQPYQPPSSYGSSAPHSGDSVNYLYEYFPLHIEDWQPPVDAVYRPHAAHHTLVPPDYKFFAARNRSKRYFAAEDVC